MKKKTDKRVPNYEDPDWGVCTDCRAISAWPGVGVTCDECGEEEYVPSDENGNPLPKPKSARKKP